MRSGALEGTIPYAPVPTSQRPTSLRFGSWFQHRPRAVQLMATSAIVVGLAYLSWRLIFTSHGVNPLLFGLLFAAELFGFVTLLFLVVDGWRIESTPRRSPLDLPTDIVIPTYDEERAIVEPTIVGALLVEGNTTIYLADDGRREEMRELAAEYGIHYVTRPDNTHAKAGNLNAILPRLTGELLLILDADHVPSPDFLQATSGYFADPNIALVQTAHSFRNHNSVMHDEEGRHEQSLFFDVLLPGRNRIGTAFWCGSAALLRTSALRAIGGMATRTSTEDFETSLTLQNLGYELRYHNEHLIQGLAPDNLAAYLIQRGRWASGTFASFKRGYRLPWSRNLTFVQRFSYTGSLLYYLSPLQRLAYTLNLVLVGVFGIIPVGYTGGWYVVFWGSWAVASLTAVAALERGTSQPFEGARNLFIGMGSFLRAIPSLWSSKPAVFNVTPKNQVDLGGWDSVRYLKVAIGLGVITGAVLLARWIDVILSSNFGIQLLPPVTPAGIFIVSAFGLFEVAIITVMVVRIWRRRQYRRMWRFPVQLRAKLKGFAGQCIDLHQEGGAFLLPADSFVSKEVVDVTLDCRRFDGTHTLAYGQLDVRSVLPVSNSKTSSRVSGVLQWNDAASQRAVIETCYVAEPYAARQQFWVRRAPRLPIDLPGSLGDQDARFIDISEHGIGCVVSRNHLGIGESLPVSITLPSGMSVNGSLDVRSVTSANGQGWRVGGLTTWSQTEWLSDFTPMHSWKALKP
jgi:cellulose synthase (UDP-forming)